MGNEGIIKKALTRTEVSLKSALGHKPRANSNSYFDAKWTQYFLRKLLFWFLSLITLGIGAPFFHCSFLRWKYSKTYIDGRRLAFLGKGLDFFVKVIIWLLLSIITLGIFLLFIQINYLRFITKNLHFEGQQDNSYFNANFFDMFFIGFSMFLLTIMTIGLALPWANALWHCFVNENSIIDGKKLGFHASGGSFFAMNIFWSMLTVFTLGFYLLLAKNCAYERFVAENIFIFSDNFDSGNPAAAEKFNVLKKYSMSSAGMESVYILKPGFFYSHMMTADGQTSQIDKGTFKITGNEIVFMHDNIKERCVFKNNKIIFDDGCEYVLKQSGATEK